MPLAKALCTNPITRIDGPARREVRDDVLAVEEPLEIRVAGRSVAVVMRTPGHDRELAAGFLVTEGLVRERDDVLDMIYCGRGDATLSSHSEHGAGAASPNLPRENVLDVVLAPGVDVDFARLSRNVFTSSSCGICSKATIEAVRREFAPLAAPVAPSRAVIAALPEKLRAAQAVFAATGALHASALFTREGELAVAREDVGRHNALDKVIGHAFFAGRLPLAGHLLCVSGRVSFEIMQKALAGGIAVVAAISAPTSAAVELARESGQTLVGFVRGERMNVYAGTLAD
jgi:FdhD protein